MHDWQLEWFLFRHFNACADYAYICFPFLFYPRTSSTTITWQLLSTRVTYMLRMNGECMACPKLANRPMSNSNSSWHPTVTTHVYLPMACGPTRPTTSDSSWSLKIFQSTTPSNYTDIDHLLTAPRIITKSPKIGQQVATAAWHWHESTSTTLWTLPCLGTLSVPSSIFDTCHLSAPNMLYMVGNNQPMPPQNLH